MSEVNVRKMAGPSRSIDISIEQLLDGRLVRTDNDLIISSQDLFGDTKKLMLEDYFVSTPDLVTTNGSTLKGNIVNLLAVNSQPLDQP